MKKNVHQIPIEWINHDGKRSKQIALTFYLEEIYKKYEKKYVSEGKLDFYGYVDDMNYSLVRFAKKTFLRYIKDCNKSKSFVAITNGSKNSLIPIENRYCTSYREKVRKRLKWLCYKYGNAHAVMRVPFLQYLL